jgi:hypothetical protein
MATISVEPSIPSRAPSVYHEFLYKTGAIAGSGIVFSALAKYFLCAPGNTATYVFGVIGLALGFYIDHIRESRTDQDWGSR